MADKYLTRKDFPAQRFVSGTIDASLLTQPYRRADIEFLELDHSGASFTARVFINNADADDKTPKDPAVGYAGEFHVFGHGGCFGDEGHCEVPAKRRDFDPRPAHPLTKARKIVTVTEAVTRLAANERQITVTVVPIVTAANEMCDVETPLHFKSLRMITYR